MKFRLEIFGSPAIQAEAVIIEEKKRGILQNDDPTNITIHSAFLRTQEETSAISKMAKFANVLPFALDNFVFV